MPRFLASVKDATEAHLALGAGADIIDFKDPAHGALGALDLATIREGVTAVAGRALTSATAGDWPLDAAAIERAIRTFGTTGVDIVKIGLLPGAALSDCIDALGPVARSQRLVAVLFADRGVPLAALPRLRDAGFAGVMIDTFKKASGGLRAHLPDRALGDFVDRARALDLMSGLAGSLRAEDIAPLVALAPDLLGFRGALCGAAGRAGALCTERLARVRSAIPASAIERGFARA